MSTDNYIFDGKGYESVPRALFLDNRLTPIERNAWVVLKMLLEADGVTSLATYEQLQPYLTTSPLTGKASTETVARALTMLRLTGWLSLTSKRRHEKGTVQGNVYVLHDEPLSIYERLHTDVEYLILLANATTHSSKTIQKVAEYTLTELINDPHVADKRLPTRLKILTEQLRQYRTEVKKLSTTSDSEANKNNLLRNNDGLNTDLEVRLKDSHSNRLRDRKDISSSKDKKILLQGLRNHLKLPSRFTELSLAQQDSGLLALSTLEPIQQQQVLDEWQKRCEQPKPAIHNPVAYLHGIIQKALQGELNLLRNTSQTTSTQPPRKAKSALSAPSYPMEPKSTVANFKLANQRVTPSIIPGENNAKPTDRVTAQRYINQIKQMLKSNDN